MSNTGKLFLIPNTIAAATNDLVIPQHIRTHLLHIRYFLAEDIRTARRYLSSLKVYDSIEALSFSVLDKDTGEEDLQELFVPIFSGLDVGVLSESGCPGVADPGALAVNFAHRKGIAVIPLVGPSSIIMGLMASGLNGQRFAFHGYLPVKIGDASKAIRELEKESKSKSQTQIIIETPYRNQNILGYLLKTLMPETQLCVAVDITGEGEFIQTRRVKDWRRDPPKIEKKPAVFLFLA